MKNLKTRTALCYIWLTIFLALVLLPALAMAAPALSPDKTHLARQNPTVRMDPAESVVGTGETFDVSVMIEEADDLGGFEFTMLCVSTTVTVDSVTVGDFVGSTGRSVIPVGPTIQAGRVSLGVATVGSAPGPSGTGVLATVTLTAQGSGQSPLDLQNVLVLDTHARHQTPTVEGGVVRVGFTVYLPLLLKDG
jgi:hypothetical protein